jgi:glutaminase A
MTASPIDGYLAPAAPGLAPRWVGDSRVRFTIQSMPKPFTYGLALQDRGFDAVDAKVGVEPSGEAFNSISLAPGSGRPLNPMINAGAITSTSLVAGGSASEREERVVDFYGRFAGRSLEVDMEVYESERDTGHRNRAIGHMLRAFGVLEDDPDEALDLYFGQCSVSVDCRDLSLMAGTLANGAATRWPATGVLERDLVDRVLSVMTTCGMYDSVGEWVVDVGMPAKSGVGGGVLAVLPGQLGIAVFSPPLDRHGNSVRGVEVCRQISTDLNLNLLHVFPDLDRVTEWCEERLLAAHGPAPARQARIGLAEHRLARGLDPSHLAALEEAVVPLRFEEGERIFALQAALLRNLRAGYYEIIGRTTREVGSFLGGR